MKTLCIYCCGGMGREVLDMVSSSGNWGEIVFVDDNPPPGGLVNGAPVHTLPVALEKFGRRDTRFIVTAGEPSVRKTLYERLSGLGLESAVVTGAGFHLSRFTSIGKGTLALEGAVVTCNVKIGEGCLINKMAVVAHDVLMGDYCVVSDNAAIGGGVIIGESCFIGAGASVRNGIRIGGNTIVGMGSVVVKDAPADSVLWGNPARVMRENKSGRVFS